MNNLLNLKFNEDQKSALLINLVDTTFKSAEGHISLIAFTIKKEIKNSNTQTII